MLTRTQKLAILSLRTDGASVKEIASMINVQEHEVHTLLDEISANRDVSNMARKYEVLLLRMRELNMTVEDLAAKMGWLDSELYNALFMVGQLSEDDAALIGEILKMPTKAILAQGIGPVETNPKTYPEIARALSEQKITPMELSRVIGRSYQTTLSAIQIKAKHIRKTEIRNAIANCLGMTFEEAYALPQSEEEEQPPEKIIEVEAHGKDGLPI